MLDPINNAISLLEGKPFKVCYLNYDTNEILLENEMTEMIPSQNDVVHLDNEKYIVISRNFFPRDNKIILLIQIEHSFLNQMMNPVRRKI